VLENPSVGIDESVRAVVNDLEVQALILDQRLKQVGHGLQLVVEVELNGAVVAFPALQVIEVLLHVEDAVLEGVELEQGQQLGRLLLLRKHLGNVALDRVDLVREVDYQEVEDELEDVQLEVVRLEALAPFVEVQLNHAVDARQLEDRERDRHWLRLQLSLEDLEGPMVDLNRLELWRGSLETPLRLAPFLSLMLITQLFDVFAF